MVLPQCGPPIGALNGCDTGEVRLEFVYWFMNGMYTVIEFHYMTVCKQ